VRAPLENVTGLPPRDGVINGIHTRPDDPQAPDQCRAGLDSAHPESSLKPITCRRVLQPDQAGRDALGLQRSPACIVVDKDNVTIEKHPITCKAMDRFDGSALGRRTVGLTVSAPRLRHLDLRCSARATSDNACMAIIGNWGFGHGLFENIEATGVSGGIGGGDTGGDSHRSARRAPELFHDFVDYVSADGTPRHARRRRLPQGTGRKGAAPKHRDPATTSSTMTSQP